MCPQVCKEFWLALFYIFAKKKYSTENEDVDREGLLASIVKSTRKERLAPDVRKRKGHVPRT